MANLWQRHRFVTADPEERPNSHFLSIGLCTFHLGDWRPNYEATLLYATQEWSQSAPGGGRTALFYTGVYYPGGRFSLAHVADV